nr:PREDICTED: adenosine kinase [Megachile rotundata]XP_012146744.1 PREDICTED: adenosine kinase [Megachile rotundata]XP_012146745.1 PREDICTED: adenosine kinase [Megachile rotundata]
MLEACNNRRSKFIVKVPLREAIANLNVPAVVAFGNPLLDAFVFLKNKDLLKKHNLTIDGETELTTEKMQELLADLQLESEPTISAGGSAQNSMRILEWLCDETFKHRYCIYCGGLGNDSKGTTLKNLVRSAGVDARYAVHSSLPTGQCIALINESSRSLVANIGAAGVYNVDDLKRCNLSLDTIKIIYIEGFFITHSFPVAKELVTQAQQRNIIVAFNLNGRYIFKDHQVAICEMVGHANIVFGNSREMEALAQALNIAYDDVADIPFLLNSLKKIAVNAYSIYKNWWSHGGVFVMTQGDSAPAIAVWGTGYSVQVEPVKPKVPVVDTTGAGDSLVAGFLAGVLANWDPKDCLEYGCKVASFMVTRLGVILPPNVPPDLIQ